MKKSKVSFLAINNWQKILIALFGTTAVSTISLPILSQDYPPIVLFQPYIDSENPYRNEKGNLLDKLKNNVQLSNLVYEIEQADLTQILKDDQFTLLAPTDDAFNNLPNDIFEKFSKENNRSIVLFYHLIPGKVTQEDIDKGKIVTVEGYEIIISNDNGKVKLNDANAKYPSTVANNGIIIEIDKVLLPPNF